MSPSVSIHVDSGRRSHIDRLIAAIAAAQHGVIARWQLCELGLSASQIDYRVRVGRLHVLHPGVYAVGHPRVAPTGRRMAAVLACGPGAVLSHAAAASHWRIVWGEAAAEVTAPRLVRRPGIVAHRVALPADETTLRDGVPVTSVARTLLDLAAVWKPDRVARALGRAEGEHLYEHASALDLAGRHPRHPGARRLVVLLEGHRPPPVTKSELEERFLAFLAARGFPPPRVNAPLRLADRWVEPDCRWDAERVVVELDSRLHDGLDAIEADHARDAALQAAGWVVMRVRWRRLHRDPDGVARELWLLLRR